MDRRTLLKHLFNTVRVASVLPVLGASTVAVAVAVPQTPSRRGEADPTVLPDSGHGMAAPRSSAAPEPPGMPGTLLLQRSPLAGFQFHRGETLWPLLAVGMRVHLIREPDNRHDLRAVRVDLLGQKLGYLPRVDNAAVSQLLDRKQTLIARIVGLRQDRDPWKRVELAITLRLENAA